MSNLVGFDELSEGSNVSVNVSDLRVEVSRKHEILFTLLFLKYKGHFTWY